MAPGGTSSPPRTPKRQREQILPPDSSTHQKEESEDFKKQLGELAKLLGVQEIEGKRAPKRTATDMLIDAVDNHKVFDVVKVFEEEKGIEAAVVDHFSVIYEQAKFVSLVEKVARCVVLEMLPFNIVALVTVTLRYKGNANSEPSKKTFDELRKEVEDAVLRMVAMILIAELKKKMSVPKMIAAFNTFKSSLSTQKDVHLVHWLSKLWNRLERHVPHLRTYCGMAFETPPFSQCEEEEESEEEEDEPEEEEEEPSEEEDEPEEEAITPASRATSSPPATLTVYQNPEKLHIAYLHDTSGENSDFAQQITKEIREMRDGFQQVLAQQQQVLAQQQQLVAKEMKEMRDEFQQGMVQQQQQLVAQQQLALAQHQQVLAQLKKMSKKEIKRKTHVTPDATGRKKARDEK